MALLKTAHSQLLAKSFTGSKENMEWLAAAHTARAPSFHFKKNLPKGATSVLRPVPKRSPRLLRLQAVSGAQVQLHSVPVQVAKELLEAGHCCLDVRTPDEFEAGHVEGAISIPIMYRLNGGMTKNPDFLNQVSRYFSPEDELVVMACHDDNRSLLAASELLLAGYNCVTGMGGGFLTWAESGLPFCVGRV